MKINLHVLSLCLMLSTKVCVHGDYILVVGVDGYSNPTGRAMDGNCCDNTDRTTCSGNRRCDNRFTFCLRPLGTNSGGTTSCASPVLTSTETNSNDGAIDFTQSTWLGLDNPLMLTGISTAWEGAQVYIEVNDQDGGGSEELVDFWRLEENPTTFPVGTTLSSSAYTGIIGRGTLTMSFQVVCAEFYSGTVCENLNECQSQSIDCNQGVCVDGDGAGTCECVPGYTGQFCGTEINECETMSIDCSGRGQCMDEINSYTCACEPGYTGGDCEEDIDECSLMEPPCSGRGNCSHGINSFSCSCEPGFTGEVCETDINECIGVTCNGRGNCTDRVNGFVCDCLSGYTGDECETDINECIGVTCNGQGNCTDRVNGFVCDCLAGYTGDECETDINECIGVTCNGQGNCTDRVNGFVCDCLSGYTGDECETDINECAGMNCSGRGQCVDLVGKFECDCEAGYAGTLCDSIDDCTDVSCSGNGECVDGENSFTCLCQPGFTGDVCSVEIQEQTMGADSGGAVAGGVIGGLLGVVLIVVIVIIIVVVIKNKQSSLKYDVSVNPTTNGFVGDNPTYGVCEMGPVQSQSHPVDDGNGLSSSLQDHEFDNPIYGSLTTATMPPLYESVEQGGGDSLYTAVESEESGIASGGISPHPNNEDIYDDVVSSHT